MLDLSKNAWLLILIHSLHWIIELFLNTFLVAYFLNLTNNNIVPVSLFYIVTYFTLTSTAVILGQHIKCGNKLLFYRFSFLVNSLSLLIIIYLKEDIVKYIWLLGLVIGAEKALFYMPQNLMTSQEAKGNLLIKFNGYRNAINNLLKILMPVAFGWFISLDSYISTASFVLLLAFAGIIPSYFLKEAKPYKKDFNFKSMLILAMRKNKIKLSLWIEMMKGFIFDVLDVLIVLYVIYMFKTNLNLGIFTSVFAICTVATNFIFGRFCKYEYFAKVLSVCALLTVAAAAYFVFDTDKLSFITYNLIFACATQVIRIAVDVNSYKVSQLKSVAVLYRTEYLTLRECFLNTGRISGFVFVIVFALAQNQEILKSLILLLNIAVALIGCLSIKLSQKLNTEDSRC